MNQECEVKAFVNALNVIETIESMTKEEWSTALGVSRWVKTKKFDTIWMVRSREGVLMAAKMLDALQLKALYDFSKNIAAASRIPMESNEVSVDVEDFSELPS